MDSLGIVGTAVVVSVQAACALIVKAVTIGFIVTVAPPVPKITAK